MWELLVHESRLLKASFLSFSEYSLDAESVQSPVPDPEDAVEEHQRGPCHHHVPWALHQQQDYDLILSTKTIVINLHNNVLQK